MKTSEKILDFVMKNPMSTAEDITAGLGINYDTIIISLNTLKRKGKVKAINSWPTKYLALIKKAIERNNGQGFEAYVEELNWKYEELKAENNRLRRELDECRRKSVGLAQRIVRENIYGNH